MFVKWIGGNVRLRCHSLRVLPLFKHFTLSTLTHRWTRDVYHSYRTSVTTELQVWKSSLLFSYSPRVAGYQGCALYRHPVHSIAKSLSGPGAPWPGISLDAIMEQLETMDQFEPWSVPSQLSIWLIVTKALQLGIWDSSTIASAVSSPVSRLTFVNSWWKLFLQKWPHRTVFCVDLRYLRDALYVVKVNK